MALCPATPIAGCWSRGALTPLELAAVVVAGFPQGTVPSTGEDIRATAYAVAKAESGGSPSACNWSGECSVGLWQINWVAHPQYEIQRLLEPDYNAEAARAISANGTNWLAWTQFRNGAYRAYLAEALWALAQITPTQVGVLLQAPSGVRPGVTWALHLSLSNVGTATAIHAWLNLHPLVGLQVMAPASGWLSDDGVWGVPNLQWELGDMGPGVTQVRSPTLWTAREGSFSLELWGGAANAEAAVAMATVMVTGVPPPPPPPPPPAGVGVALAAMALGGIGFLTMGPPGLLKGKKVFI